MRFTGIGSLSPADAQLAYEAAQKVVQTHLRLAEFLRPGQTMAQIDTFVASTLDSLGCKSCFLHYRPRGHRGPAFPSHACLSVNDCVVHGTAAYPKPLGPGDIVKIDIGVWYKGFIGDAGWTYFVSPISPVAAQLLEAGKLSLSEGVKELTPQKTWSAWAERVHEIVVKRNGFHLTQGLGGHGIGRSLHAGPFISNSPQSVYEWSDGAKHPVPGTLVAVEPMLAIGTGEIRYPGGSHSWPVHSADGSLTAHYEHDILITEGDPVILTDGLQNVRDEIRT